MIYCWYVPGDGPFSAVLDLCTFMSEKRACLLANKGFVVLAVAVYTDKPENIKEMHLDHFKEAVDFLQQHPKVSRWVTLWPLTLTHLVITSVSKLVLVVQLKQVENSNQLLSRYSKLVSKQLLIYKSSRATVSTIWGHVSGHINLSPVFTLFLLGSWSLPMPKGKSLALQLLHQFTS